MKLKALVTAVLIAFATVPTAVLAQAPAAATQMPPALRAAVNSGNPTAISQAINALAAGNPQRIAQLAAQVASAAEAMLAVNPQAALAAAQAATDAVRSAPVQAANVSAVQQVLASAARIAIHPDVVRLNPQIASQFQLSITGVLANNPQLASIADSIRAIIAQAPGSNPGAGATSSYVAGSPASAGSGAGSGGGGTSAR